MRGTCDGGATKADFKHDFKKGILMIGKASGDVAASAPGIYGDLRAQSNKGFAADAVNAVARREAMITAQLGREAQPLGGGGCGGGGAAAKSGDCDSFCRGAQ